MDDNRQWIYNSLKDKGYDLGSYDDFDKNINSEDSRKWVYDNAQKSGINIGSYDEFNNALGALPPAGIRRPTEAKAMDSNVIPPVPSVSPADLDKKSESPYVEGKGKDVKVFGVPYNDYTQMSPEQQSEAYNNAINQRKEKQNEELGIQIEGLKGNIAAVKKEKGENIQKDENIGFFSRLFRSPQQEQQAYNKVVSTPDVKQAEKVLSDLDMYKRQQQDDKKGLNDVQKGINEAGRLLPETLKSIGTFGISHIADEIETARSKGQDAGPLVKSANELYNKYTQLNQLDYSLARDIASGGLQSADFVAQYALTGGLVSGITKGLGKIIASKIGGSLSARAIGGAAEHIGNTLARITIMPSTYSTAVDIMNQTDAGFPDAWSKAMGINFIEVGTEGMGEYIPGIGIANKTKIGRYILDSTKGFRRVSGIQGLVPEGAEEQFATAFHAMAGDGQGKWSDLIDPHNQLMTAGVLAVMQIPHVSIASGSYVAGKAANRVQNYSINKAYNNNLTNLREQFGGDESANSSEIVDFVNQSVKNARSGQDIDALINLAANSKDLTEGQRDAIAKYAVSYNAKSAMDEGKKAAVSEIVNKETEDIKSNSDPSTWIYTEANRITTGDKGERVAIPGYVAGHIGDVPLWKPEGSGPDAPAIPLKEHEIEIVGSMPTQDVIDATTKMVQDQASSNDDFESKYDPSIADPAQGISFTGLDGAQYDIVQQNANGGWIADRTILDDKGKPQTQAVEISNEDYYNAKQKELDDKENINLSDLQPESESTTGGEQNKVSENKPENVQKQEEVAPVQEQQEIPVESVIYKKDDKGKDTNKVDYEKMPIQNTIYHLNSLAGDEGRAYKSISKKLSKEKEAYGKAQKAFDKIEGEGIDYTDEKEVAAYEKAKQSVDEAKQKVDYWTSVNDEIESTRVQEGDKTAEAIRTMGEPLNGEELAAQMLAEGKLPILFDSYKKETGYKNGEGRKMIGLFSSKKNGGMSIEQAGEQLMLADQENGTNFFDQNDPNAGRNAILYVLSQSTTRGDLFNFIKKSRDAMAEKERQAEYDAYSAFTQTNFGMTPEEYDRYEEAVSKTLPDKSLSESEYNDFMSNFEPNNNENDNTGGNKQEIAGNEQSGIQGVGEQSSEVLSGEQPVPTERTGETETGSVQTDAGVNNENVAKPKREREKGKLNTPEYKGGNILDFAEQVSTQKEIQDAGKEVNTNPSMAQKEAGNSKMGHVKIDGLDITIENPKGSERSGVDQNGKEWSITMNNDYGYIRGTKSVDGDHVDVFIGPNTTSPNVYVVDQVNPDGTFDEFKVMYGFDSEEEARKAYLSNYKKGWKGLGNITEISKEDFKKWLDSSTRKTKPFAEYKIAQNDNQNNVGVQSNLERGTESKQGKSIPTTSEEEAQGSGVLQTPEKVSDVPAMTEEEYLASKGYGSNGIGEPALSKGRQKSEKQQNKIVELQAAKDKEYADKREELRKEYKEKIESGELRGLTTIEKLIKTANGNPRNESTKAARRSLKKRGLDWESEDKRFRTGEQTNEEKTEDVSDAAQSLSAKLNTPVKVLNSIDELPMDVRSRVEKGQRVKGWYDPKTGEVVVYAPNAEGEADVNATILHEIVGHKGLRALFGDKFDDSLQSVYKSLPKKVRAEIAQSAVSNYSGNTSIATEEYLAEQAEKNEIPSWWNKVVSGIRDLLRNVGINVEMSDNDVKYLLWRSRNNLETSNPLSVAEDISMRNKLANGEVVSVPFVEYNNDIRYRVDNKEEKSSDGTREKEIPQSIAQSSYDKATKGRLHEFTESWFDFLRSVDKLQESIMKETGQEIKGFENAYQKALANGSISSVERSFIENALVDPLSDHVAKMVKGRKFRGHEMDMNDVNVYLNSKHGLERNRKFAERDAERDAIDSGEKEGSEGYKKVYNESLNNNLKKDYSGLTEIFDPEKEGLSVQQLEEKANEYVKEFEDMYDSKEINKLWDHINSLTSYSLGKSYKSGLLSKNDYDHISSMFQYYVPLRGFNGEVASDFYDYINRYGGENKPQNTVKKAIGRTTQADDILSTMANMANSAIIQGNKNVVSQTMLNLALNHKTPLISVSKQWYEHSENGTDIPLYPNLSENMTPDERRKAIEDFDSEMAKKAEGGNVFEKRDGLNVKFIIEEKWQADNHAVRVMRNGKEYIMWINGNPKAAQALNGELNPNSDSGKIEQLVSSGNRQLARYQTSLSPEFIIRNLQRDLLMSNITTYIKEGGRYWINFNKNVKDNLAFIAVKGENAGKYDGIYSLYMKMKNGTLNENNERERYFKEFIENGGETGYSVLYSKDEWKAKIQKRINKNNTVHGKVIGQLESIADGIEFANKGIENVCRFAAYMTSRQMGKDVSQSVIDAKEVSVNFNKKGSGRMGNKLARSLFLYLNPSLQSVYQLTGLFKKYPKRAIKAFSLVVGLGFANSLVQRLISSWFGDDDKYQDLSSWKRRNNICVYGGENGFATWALPPELRSFYGIGEITSSTLNGEMKYENIPMAIISQMQQMSPWAFLEENKYNESEFWKTAFKSFLPTAVRYGFDAYLFNEDFLGRKINNEQEWNRYDPEWKRVTRGTNTWFIEASKILNELTGGNDYKKGFADTKVLNPGSLEYLFNSYFGGLGTFGSKLIKTGQAIAGNEDMQEVRNIPMLSAIYTSTNDEYAKNYKINEAYNYYKNIFKIIDNQVSGSQKDLFDYHDLRAIKVINDLNENGEYKLWVAFKNADKDIQSMQKGLYDARNRGDKDAEKKLSEAVYKIKEKLIEAIEKE